MNASISAKTCFFNLKASFYGVFRVPKISPFRREVIEFHFECEWVLANWLKLRVALGISKNTAIYLVVPDVVGSEIWVSKGVLNTDSLVGIEGQHPVEQIERSGIGIGVKALPGLLLPARKNSQVRKYLNVFFVTMPRMTRLPSRWRPTLDRLLRANQRRS